MKDSDSRTTSASAVTAAGGGAPLDGDDHDRPSMRSSTVVEETEGGDEKLENAASSNLVSADDGAPLSLREENQLDFPDKILGHDHEMHVVDEGQDETYRTVSPASKKNGGNDCPMPDRTNNLDSCNGVIDSIADTKDEGPKEEIDYDQVNDSRLHGSEDNTANNLNNRADGASGNKIEQPVHPQRATDDIHERGNKIKKTKSREKLQNSSNKQAKNNVNGMEADRSKRKPKHNRPRLPESSMANDNSSTYSSNRSLQSARSRTSARKSSKKPKGARAIPLKATPPNRSSLLTRGMSRMSLFAKSSNLTRFDKYDDASSIMSEMSQDMKSVRSAPKLDKNSDDVLRQHLKESGLVLLKRLIEFLSELPPDETSSVAGKKVAPNSKQKKKHRGLTLPAAAIGWLSTQIDDTCNYAFEGLGDCYQIPKQQLQVLQSLLKRVTSLRISGEAWPPPHASTSKAAKPEKVGISTKLLSTISGDQSVGGDSCDDESCTTGVNETEVVVSAFRRYYHELQAKPDVDMSFFPNATKVVIDGIPPNWVANLDLLQNLSMFQIEKGCILDVNQLFFPSDVSRESTIVDVSQKSPHPYRRDLSLVDEGKEKEGALSLSDESGKLENSSPVVYPSLSKLRLSNCAMGEAAGLRGRRPPSKSVPRLPTFSRFPNLTSLNLSKNELFKTKTVFAGLSSLPLLSSINLSYNRLSSLDDIFMHIGNVTELILTGNEISSTRGLDRLFSLERLSLDENNIHDLANIAGIAKIPFLMQFDIQGNPYFETDDPASCRIKVFNLFREVRCNNLAKNATFRDMQQLLPAIDNELATKDELVALKGLTFRQTVISVDSMSPSASENKNADSKSIDDSSEISVNMPDSGSGGFPRVVKSSPAKLVHFRMAGSASLEKKAAGRLERFRGHAVSSGQRKDSRRQVKAQFSMAELIASIRPEIISGDNSAGTVLRAASFSSHRSEIKDDSVSDSPEVAFPFSLPPILLAEAGDDVWTPSMQVDLIVPSDANLWEMRPSDDDVEQNSASGLAPEDEAIGHDDASPPRSNEELNEGDRISSCINDGTEIASASRGQESAKEDSEGSESEDAVDEISNLKPRKTMFGGIWEQSYRDNVTKINVEVDMDPTESTEQTTPDLLDFNAEEQDSQYDGPSDYRSLFVSSDLDLYFDSYIFHRSEGDSQEDSQKRTILAPRIQLYKFDRVNSRPKSLDSNVQERYIGVWKEDVLACGSYARSRLAPIRRRKRGFHGETMSEAGKEVMISESRKFIICLSDSALYFIIDDDRSPQESTGEERTFPSRVPPNSTFSDAHWPHAVVRHSLDSLRGITIGFQFQRLILSFSVGNSASSSSFEYAYVISTSNKIHTVSFLQKLQSHVTDAQPGMGALIDNDDKTFLDALGVPRSNEVVIHYQILHQIWKRGDREASRRAFVLTDSKAYLLDETYYGDDTMSESEEEEKKLGQVSLAIIDSAILSRVTEVRAANEDPRKITLVILPQSKFKRSHRWRLVCNDGEGAERLIDDVRRATNYNCS